MKLSQNLEVEESPPMEETNVPHQRVKWDRKAIKKKIEEADDFITKACQFLPKHLRKTGTCYFSAVLLQLCKHLSVVNITSPIDNVVPSLPLR
jgi:hypothetical protein